MRRSAWKSFVSYLEIVPNFHESPRSGPSPGPTHLKDMFFVSDETSLIFSIFSLDNPNKDRTITLVQRIPPAEVWMYRTRSVCSGPTESSGRLPVKKQTSYSSDRQILAEGSCKLSDLLCTGCMGVSASPRRTPAGTHSSLTATFYPGLSATVDRTLSVARKRDLTVGSQEFLAPTRPAVDKPWPLQ